jgi:type II secretory pathway pseudopilin PulG
MSENQTGVMMRARRDLGESLVEIVFTIMIIGLTVGALLYSLTKASDTGNVQRVRVQADSVLRSYAATVKAAGQSCVAGHDFIVSYAAPAPFSVSPIPTGTECPGPIRGPETGAEPYLLPLTLTVTVLGPLSFHDSVDVVVRTP